jgi:calcineurin-like phosphoesterase family protein
VTTYFSSDWHLGHKRILELCDRPFKDTIDMDDTIIQRCNDVVTEADTLILLGDIAMGTYANSLIKLRRIRAQRILWIPGNHDRFSKAYANSEARRLEARNTLTMMGLFPQEDRKPSQWHMRVFGRKIAMSHYPYVGDSREEARFKDLRPHDEGLPLVHGHVHTKWRQNGRMLNVGVDVWDFAPVSVDAVNTWLLGLNTLPSEATA